MSQSKLITPVLIGGSLIVLVSFAIRSVFGLFQIPIEAEFGWSRVEFSLAIAIQNLAWGLGQPILSAFAERFGDRRAIAVGTGLYAVGLVLSALAWTPIQHQVLSILIGLGVAGSGFGVILAVVGRAASDENRSMALAITSAVGAGGQILGPPIVAVMLETMHWSTVYFACAAAIIATLLLLPLLRAPARSTPTEVAESMRVVLARAMRDPSYTLIVLGFFACGFHVAFITAHFPAYIAEVCGPIEPGGLIAGLGIGSLTALGGAAIAVVGAANIVGTLVTGWIAKFVDKRYILASLYALRTIVMIVFLSMPVTPGSVLIFSGAMGLLWLATVPLTAGLVGYIYGLRYMGTLYGFVFLSHQIGSFVGVWLGGELYDRSGSYDTVWWIGVGVGAFSALVHLPVRERPLLVSRTA